MAKTATNVRVALTGSVYVAPEGTTFPDTISEEPGSEFAELGYTTEDGVTFSVERNTEDIMGWQSTEPLRTIVTSEPKMATFVLRQLETATWLAAFGGEITEPDDVGNPGEFLWTPPAPGTLLTQALIVEFNDVGASGDIDYRFLFYRALRQGTSEAQLVRTDAVNLPIEYGMLADEPRTWEVQTNDPEFAPPPAE